MLTVDEMHGVTKNPRYKITKWPISNMKYIRGSYKSSDTSAKISFDFKFNADKTSGIGSIQFMLWCIFKPIIIATEIGDIRARVIESYLNDTVEDDDLYEIFYIPRYWLEYKVSKIIVLKEACIRLLKDPRIEKIIFDACKHLGDEQKKQQYKAIINRLDEQFEKIIEECVVCTKQNEIIELLIKTHSKEELIEILGKDNIAKLFEKEEVIEMFKNNWDSGLLTNM